MSLQSDLKEYWWLVLGAALILIVVIVAGVSAHTGTAPTVDCKTVSADFQQFPEGNHDITFEVTVNGKTDNVQGSFNGSSGTASADISSLTSATGVLDISAKATWTDDGGGETETTTIQETCHEEEPPEPPKEEKPPVEKPEILTPEDVGVGK